MGAVYRHWLLLQMIPRAPRRIDTKALEAQLHSLGHEVHRRTIQRDLEKLSEIFPLACDDREKPFGWSWSREAPAFDIPHMDPATALSFRLMSQFLEGLLPPATLQHLQPHIRQAGKVLDLMEKADYRSWPEKVRVMGRMQPLMMPDLHSSVLQVVYESLLEGKKLKATYCRRGEINRVEYEINPLGLVFLDHVLYLVCTMWSYDQLENVRQLALHRMTEAWKLEASAIVPEGFCLDTYIKGGAFGYLASEQTVRLKALFERDAALHLGVTPLGENQRLTEQDHDTILVEATVLDTAQLRWWLLGFGGRIEVLEPAGLREDMRRHARRMAQRYA